MIILYSRTSPALKPLLLQIFLPETKAIAGGQARTFQFQIFNTLNGGKIIKETLKYFTRERRHIVFEERYRVRPMNNRDKNEDLSHSINLPVLAYSDWIRLLTKVGFVIIEQYSDFNFTPFTAEKSGLLLLKAKAS